jgi:hypothetical protein
MMDWPSLHLGQVGFGQQGTLFGLGLGNVKLPSTGFGFV